MKRYLSVLIACLLLVLTASSAFASTIDMSYVEENNDVFVIDPSDDATAIFIETVLTAEERHYTHKYESDYYWSDTKFDVLCLGMDGDDQYPVFRCWITFANDTKYYHIDSATFVLNDVRYTFTDIGNPASWHRTRENDDGTTTYLEDLLIKFGPENVEFPAMLEAYRHSLPEDLSGFDCQMILHAAGEDITVTLRPEFLLDFKLMLDAYIELGGLDSFGRINPTVMNVR